MGLSCLNVLAYAYFLKLTKATTIFGKVREVLFPDSVIDFDGYILSLPLDYVSYHFPC